MCEEKSSCNFIEPEDINMSFNKWDDLDIHPNLLRGIYNYGFEDPSPIQKQAIIPINKKRDIIAQAQSGTGKTGTFVIGALSHVDVDSKTTQILILAPTHELSKQIAHVMEGIGSMMNGLNIKVLIGGSYIDSDIEYFRNNTPHVIVGCPGRVFDMIRRNHIIAENIKLVVLDEADEKGEILEDIITWIPQYATTTSDHYPLLCRFNSANVQTAIRQIASENVPFFRILGNPITEILHLEITANPHPIYIKIIQQDGKLVQQQTIYNNIETTISEKISLHHLASGHYFIHCKNGNNEEVKGFVKY